MVASAVHTHITYVLHTALKKKRDQDLTQLYLTLAFRALIAYGTVGNFVLHSALHWLLFFSKLPQLNLSITLTLDTIVGLHCRLVKGSICWFFMLWLSAWRRNSTWFCWVCHLHYFKSSHNPPSMQLLMCYVEYWDQRKTSNITD